MTQPIADIIQSYRAAVAAEPTSAEAHSNLGWGYYGQHQYSESVSAFREALSLDRNMIDAHYGLGLALKESGGQTDAVAAFEAVIALAPQLENSVRGQMLARLAQGHINQIQKGHWDLGQAMRNGG